MVARYRITEYVDRSGGVPVSEWLANLREVKGKVAILMRLERVELGNLGSFRSVGGGVLELIVDVGPGYRVYFARTNAEEVLLLGAGSTATQRRDIGRARDRWTDFRRRNQSSGFRR